MYETIILTISTATLIFAMWYLNKIMENKKNSLDEAIDEFKNGDVIRCENFADYQKKMRG